MNIKVRKRHFENADSNYTCVVKAIQEALEKYENATVEEDGLDYLISLDGINKKTFEIVFPNDFSLSKTKFDVKIKKLKQFIQEFETTENTIEITIKPKHFRLATRYNDITNCPLARACKEHFKTDEITCDCGTVSDSETNINYKIVDSWRNYTPGDRNGTDETVDSLIKKAKQKKKVGNYIVKIIKE